MYRKTRYWQYIRASLSFSLVMTYNMHVQKHSILTIYSGLSLSRYYVQHACTETPDTDNIFGPLSLSVSLRLTTFMYQNPRYWQYIRASLSLSRYDVQYACTETADTDNIFGSLSRYDVQHACTETLNIDNIFGALCLSRYDVQHAFTETLDTDNIFGPLSLSLVMTYTCMYRNTQHWQYIRASLSLSLSRFDVQHACTEPLNTDNIFGLLSLSFSLSLWRTTCMYRNNRYWQYIWASLSLSISLVMTYNMHLQKHSILTIHSGLSLSLSHYDMQHACTDTLDTDNIFGPLSLSPSLSLWLTTCMNRNTRYWQYIRASLSLSHYDEQHACTDTLNTDNIFGPLYLSLVMT